MIRNCCSEDTCSSKDRLDNNFSPNVIETKGNLVQKIVPPKKFKNDIEALKNHVGEDLVTGLCIKISLQEILTVIPRERHRTDAYQSLVKYLKDEMGVILSIEGRNIQINTKSYEK